jgi:hypothetical protein
MLATSAGCHLDRVAPRGSRLIIGLKAPVHARQDMKPSCPGSLLSSVERLSQANELGRPDGIASLDETLRGRRVRVRQFG